MSEFGLFLRYFHPLADKQTFIEAFRTLLRPLLPRNCRFLKINNITFRAKIHHFLTILLVRGTRPAQSRPRERAESESEADTQNHQKPEKKHNQRNHQKARKNNFWGNKTAIAALSEANSPLPGDLEVRRAPERLQNLLKTQNPNSLRSTQKTPKPDNRSPPEAPIAPITPRKTHSRQKEGPRQPKFGHF